MTTYGPELRSLLLTAIRQVASGEMSLDAGQTICDLAQQANNSVVAETRLISQLPASNAAGAQLTGLRVAAE